MDILDSQVLIQANETPKAYRIRLYKNKELYGLTNEEIGKLCNKAFGVEWDESAHRKKTHNYLKGYNDAKAELGDADQQLQNMIQENTNLIHELQKEQVKTRDERNELRRIIREEARKESYREQLLRSIKEFQCKPLNYDEVKRLNLHMQADNDLLISCFDVHAGIETRNFWNMFDEVVLKRRLNEYLDKIFEIQIRHGSENAYVVLSELVSGLIHPTLRIENNQDMIEQFLCVANYLTEFISELSYKFNKVHVYIAPGNHGRLSPKKEDNITNENMDNLILPFLEAQLQNFSNVECHKNNIHNAIAMFSIRNCKVFSSHGDKETLDKAIPNLTLFTGIRPDIYLCGHRHTNAMMTVYDSKVLQAGCISGADSYCMDNRLRNKPEQLVAVITDNGLDCLYDVKFH